MTNHQAAVARARSNVTGVAQALSATFVISKVNVKDCEVIIDAPRGYKIQVSVDDDAVMVDALSPEGDIVAGYGWETDLDRVIDRIIVGTKECIAHKRHVETSQLPRVTPTYREAIQKYLPMKRVKDLMFGTKISMDEFMAGVEYWMRIEHRTLDGLLAFQPRKFGQEVVLGVDLISLDLANKDGSNRLYNVLASYK